MNVMVDIESLGTERGAVILAIGAVQFDEDGLGDEYYCNIDIETSQQLGLEIDANTLQWWLGQSEEARERNLYGDESLTKSLIEFKDFIEGTDTIWANSHSFDCSLLRGAYEAAGLNCPWSYYDERCFRTLVDVFDVDEPEFEGTRHIALDDAKHQARTASYILSEVLK